MSWGTLWAQLVSMATKCTEVQIPQNEPTHEHIIPRQAPKLPPSMVESSCFVTSGTGKVRMDDHSVWGPAVLGSFTNIIILWVLRQSGNSYLLLVWKRVSWISVMCHWNAQVKNCILKKVLKWVLEENVETSSRSTDLGPRKSGQHHKV